MRRLSFANSSTCAFKLAELRMVGGLASAGRLDLTEKRWCEDAQFCQFEHLCA